MINITGFGLRSFTVIELYYSDIVYLLYLSKRSHGEEYFISQGIGMHCDICNKLVPGNMWNHKMTYHHSKRVACPHCGVTVKDSGLKLHIEKNHTEGRRTYYCEKCDKTYKDNDQFKFHLVAQHNDTSKGNVRVFTCEYCQRKAPCSSTLEKHTKIVHGE